jgi:hypothetical protein
MTKQPPLYEVESPVRIAPNLEPGIQVEGAWITVRCHDFDFDQLYWTITVIRPGCDDFVDTGLSTSLRDFPLPVGDVDRLPRPVGVYNALSSALSFMDAEAEKYQGLMSGRHPEDGWIFGSEEFAEWCYVNSDELFSVQLEIDELRDNEYVGE